MISKCRRQHSGEYCGWGKSSQPSAVYGRFLCLWWGVVVQQNNFAVSCSPFWSLFDQCLAHIDHLLTVASVINCFTWFQKLMIHDRHPSDPTKCTALSCFQSDLILRSMLMVVFSNDPMQKKSISFMLRKQNFAHHFSVFHLSVVQLMRYPFSSLLDLSHGMQTITKGSATNTQPLIFYYWVFVLSSSNNACNSVSSNSFGWPGFSLSFKSKSQLLNRLDQRTQASCIGTLSP